jgi:hypothetical protein
MVVVTTAETPSSSSQAVAPVAQTSSNSSESSSAEFFVKSLACVLTHLVSLKESPSTEGEPLTVFHAVRVPSVSIHDYLFRIARYFLCSPECFVIALVYIDRVMKKQPDFTVCKLNIHRLIVTSMMLAVKFFDDVYYSNAYYAKVGGVKGPEMNVLEIHFLRLIDWQLFVSPEEFDLYKTNVLVAVAGNPAPACADDQPPISRHISKVEDERRPAIRRTRTEFDDEGYGVDEQHIAATVSQ